MSTCRHRRVQIGRAASGTTLEQTQGPARGTLPEAKGPLPRYLLNLTLQVLELEQSQSIILDLILENLAP